MICRQLVVMARGQYARSGHVAAFMQVAGFGLSLGCFGLSVNHR